jgi:histidine ammonia-lyase
LARVYQRDLGAPPKYPDAVTAIKQKPDQLTAKIEFLSTALHEHVTVSDDRFRRLGEQRAQALEQALLTETQIDAGRVFLVANDKATAKDGAVRLELSLR